MEDAQSWLQVWLSRLCLEASMQSWLAASPARTVCTHQVSAQHHISCLTAALNTCNDVVVATAVPTAGTCNRNCCPLLVTPMHRMSRTSVDICQRCKQLLPTVASHLNLGSEVLLHPRQISLQMHQQPKLMRIVSYTYTDYGCFWLVNKVHTHQHGTVHQQAPLINRLLLSASCTCQQFL